MNGKRILGVIVCSCISMLYGTEKIFFQSQFQKDWLLFVEDHVAKQLRLYTNPADKNPILIQHGVGLSGAMRVSV